MLVLLNLGYFIYDGDQLLLLDVCGQLVVFEGLVGIECMFVVYLKMVGKIVQDILFDGWFDYDGFMLVGIFLGGLFFGVEVKKFVE